MVSPKLWVRNYGLSKTMGQQLRSLQNNGVSNYTLQNDGVGQQ